MSQYQTRFQGTRLEGTHSMKYHTADRNGRFYLCGCMPCFRVGDRIVMSWAKRYKIAGIKRR